MTSTAEQPPLMNGGDEDDPYKSEGHVELRIENMRGFFEEEIGNEHLSDPVYLRGVPWKICACALLLGNEPAQYGHMKPKRLKFYLEYNGSTDPSRTYEAIAKLKILAQKNGTVDHVYEDKNTSNLGIKAAWDFLGEMTVEELMDPDKGWYDERSDSIVVAMDLTVNLAEGNLVGEYVLVAQSELTLDKVPTSICIQIGNFQWQIDYAVNDQSGEDEKLAVFSCEDVARGRADKVLLELFGYHLDGAKSEAFYSPIFDRLKPVHRHLFTRKNNSLTVKVNVPYEWYRDHSEKVLFTARVFKERIHFPDFTKPTALVGRFQADVKLRVGDQLFHVNRQLISTLSPVLDGMFNLVFDAATQQEVKLVPEMHSPELFHHFLLVMFNNETLPNSLNVAAMFKLADYYDVENVRQKCDQHLRMAREVPIEKRVLLARKHGSKETRTLIVNSANPEQLKKISLSLIQNR